MCSCVYRGSRPFAGEEVQGRAPDTQEGLAYGCGGQATGKLWPPRHASAHCYLQTTKVIPAAKTKPPPAPAAAESGKKAAKKQATASKNAAAAKKAVAPPPAESDEDDQVAPALPKKSVSRLYL